MQLSVSNAPLNIPPGSARSSSAGRAPAAGDPPAAPASDSGQPAEFDDLLQADAEKSKTGRFSPPGARGGTSAKLLRGDAGVATDSAATVSALPPDVATMLALMATPAAAPDATPITLPEFDGGFRPVATAEGAETPVSSGESCAAPSARTVISLPRGAPAVPVPPSPPAATPATVTPPAPPPDAKSRTLSSVATPAAALEPLPPAVPAAPTAPEADLLAEVADFSAQVMTPLETPRNLPPARMERGVKPVPGGGVGANIAAPAAVSSGLEKMGTKLASGNFLVPNEQMVDEGDDALGIDVAKLPVTMASALFSQPHSAAAEVPAFVAAPHAPAEVASTSSTNHLTETKSVAQGAVEAVLSAADRVSTDRSSVTLQFSLGGNDLAVHVDFRGGAVQATFRTDSPELRAALAHEWSAAGSKMTDASVRMAPPVFTSSDAGTSTSFSGQSAHDQHQQQRESSSRSAGGAFPLNTLRPLHAASSGASRSPSAAVRQAVSTALHLHTFA